LEGKDGDKLDSNHLLRCPSHEGDELVLVPGRLVGDGSVAFRESATMRGAQSFYKTGLVQ